MTASWKVSFTFLEKMKPMPKNLEKTSLIVSVFSVKDEMSTLISKWLRMFFSVPQPTLTNNRSSHVNSERIDLSPRSRFKSLPASVIKPQCPSYPSDVLALRSHE